MLYHIILLPDRGEWNERGILRYEAFDEVIIDDDPVLHLTPDENRIAIPF